MSFGSSTVFAAFAMRALYAHDLRRARQLLHAGEPKAATPRAAALACEQDVASRCLQAASRAELATSARRHPPRAATRSGRARAASRTDTARRRPTIRSSPGPRDGLGTRRAEIGRASCRERV